MLYLRYITRLIVAYTKRFKGIIFLSILFGALIFISTKFVAPLFLQKSVEKIGITGRYHTDEMPSFILDKLSDGLTKVGKDGVAEPGLAERWETPDKGKTWIFHLKDNLLWQDETPVTSKNIVYEFSDVEIETPDDKTIVFKLENQFSPFPTIVSRSTFKKGLLGTGEWKVDKATIAGGNVQELVIQRQKETINYKFYPTEERTKLAFKLGEVDKLINVFDATPLKDWSTTKVTEDTNTSQVVTIFFNTKDPLLSEKNLRQALIYAIDKQDFTGQRAITPIPPSSWAFNPLVKPYDFNRDRAKEFVDDLPDELKQKFPIKLVTTSALLPVAEKISDYWSLVGVDNVIQVSSIIPNEFQAFLTIYDLPKDPDQYAVWHSTQEATNISNYANPRIDKLLEDGRSELTIEERKKTYLDFQRFLLEDLPAGFLYHPTHYTIERK